MDIINFLLINIMRLEGNAIVKLRNWYFRKKYNLKNDICAKKSFMIYGKGSLEIGRNCHFGSYSRIDTNKKVSIGNNVIVGSYSYIMDSDHDYNSKERISNYISKPVLVGDNVWIGTHCVILKGVAIGDSSVIGAGSVVTKKIPANEVWAGNPAKRIKVIE